MYCTVDDLRAAGVTEDDASDEKLRGLIALAQNYIERMTHQWFEPRKKTIRLNGTGGEVLPLPVLLIDPETVIMNGVEVTDYVNYNRIGVLPADDRGYPKLHRSRRWREGVLNIGVTGLWGYIDEDEDGNPFTPPLIKRATMKLALYNFPDLGDREAQEEKALSGVLKRERTDNHEYELAENVLTAMATNAITGDAEIDDIIRQYAAMRVRMAVL